MPARWLLAVLVVAPSVLTGCGPASGEFVAISNRDKPVMVFQLCNQATIDQISIYEHKEGGRRWSALGPGVVQKELPVFSKPESWDITGEELTDLEPGRTYGLSVHISHVPSRTAYILFSLEQLASLSDGQVVAATSNSSKPVVVDRQEFERRAQRACDRKS